jgi:hypothetical protein
MKFAFCKPNLRLRPDTFVLQSSWFLPCTVFLIQDYKNIKLVSNVILFLICEQWCLSFNTLHCKEDTMVSPLLRPFHLINYPLIETENY